MKIQTELKIDSAHRLQNYSGKCFNVHGHSWKIVVIVDADIKDEQGFVVDFNKIKELIMKLDHSYICSKEDEVGTFLLDRGFNVIRLEENPTAEFLSEYLAYRIKDLGILGERNRFNFVTVKVYESDVSFAEITL